MSSAAAQLPPLPLFCKLSCSRHATTYQHAQLHSAPDHKGVSRKQLAAVVCLPALACAAVWACVRPSQLSLGFAAGVAGVYALGIAICRTFAMELQYQARPRLWAALFWVAGAGTVLHVACFPCDMELRASPSSPDKGLWSSAVWGLVPHDPVSVASSSGWGAWWNRHCCGKSTSWQRPTPGS